MAMNLYSLAFLILFQFPSAISPALEFPHSPASSDNQQKQNKGVAANIIFKSTDGGQTWQDISEGLPENLQATGFVEKDSELYLRAGTGLYHSNRNFSAPFWEKDSLPDKESSIAAGKTGVFAYNYQNGQFSQKKDGASLWQPMFPNFPVRQARTIFDTVGGTIFIGSDRGLYKSIDRGKTWKPVHTGGWVMKLIESNGVLLATSQGGILRSTDDGENWDYVISEGGVGIAVERIKGGFAAISCNTESETRRVRTSYDGGKTWQAIDAGLPASLYISSIIEVGENLFCGHPTGIFRSSDKGKTWELLLPSIEDKVFNLSVCGSVIYAMPKAGGC
jgi:photosystem II stability/assembly factor-like uncharacterized protein